MRNVHHRRVARLIMACLMLATGVVASPAFAALTYVFDTTAAHDVPGVLDASIGGVDMRGLEVTVLRTDGETDTRVMGATTAGGAIGIGWALNFIIGDTDVDAWHVANSLSHAPIHQIILHGQASRVLFDVDMYNLDQGGACSQYGPSGGLPLTCSTGSGQGHRFSYAAGDFDATVTYSDPVGLAGAAPIGDLFYTMIIEFARPGMAAATFSFLQDTDLAARSPVPLPMTMVLFGSGALGILGIARRPRGDVHRASDSSAGGFAKPSSAILS